MGKRVKKKSRAVQKDKRATAHSPKIAPQQKNPSVDTIIDGVAVVKERKPCAHIEKGFNLNNLTEKLGSSDPLKCEDCREGVADRRGAKGKGKHGKRKGSVDSKSESKAIWVCLECGHFACGGVGLPTTPQSHAVRHARQTRHPLVIQWENPHLRWCFQCNTLIPVETTEDDGEKKDVLSDAVKLMKTRLSERPSVDVEDVWFGSGTVASEIKAEGSMLSSLEGRGGYSVRGLVNLGNTCFFNSVMQNLLAMDKLQEYFFNHDASYGSLTIALKKLYHETKPETGLKNVINPRSFFGCICSKAPQFRGYQQQDSHELLRCLLDGLSSEELVMRKQINTSSEDGISLKQGPTFVDAVFGGRISSTVSCIECGHSSTVYEPFLDLSLSVPTKKPPTKKAQHSRQKKTKLPPKRGGRVRAVASKDADLIPAESISNSCGSPSQAQSTIPDVKNMMASSGDIAGPGSDTAADKNGLASQNIVVVPNIEKEQVAVAAVEQTDTSFDNFWMDCIGPETVSDDQDISSQNNDVSSYQHSGNMILNNGSMECSQLCSVDPEPNLKLDSSSVNPWEEEVPLQVNSSEVLLLPYKEERYTDGATVKGEAEASSSAVGSRQDEADFDGFGDLFNEPEISSGPVVGPSLGKEAVGTGFAAANSSESDPDEVDNSDSPVSVESCLAHFIKPELLSNDNAWECENCSKTLQRKRLEVEKKQAKSGLKTMVNGGESLVSDNGNIDCSNKNCVQTEGGQTDEQRLIVSQTKEKKGEMSADFVEPFNSSAPYKSSSQENFSYPAVSSSTVDEPSSTGYATAKDQLSDSHCSGNCEADGDEHQDEERTSRKVKVKRDATKRVLVDKAPPILTIHLKRFSQDARGRLSKLNGHVNFGVILDLRPYMDARCPDREGYVYRLLGVVEHLGTMRGGHYVAYVRGSDRSKGKAENENGSAVWYHVNDAYIREVSLEEVLSCEAYILFYEKV